MGPESLRAGAVELGGVDEGLIDVDVCHLEVVECGVVGLLAAGLCRRQQGRVVGKGGVSRWPLDARELYKARGGVELSSSRRREL